MRQREARMMDSRGSEVGRRVSPHRLDGSSWVASHALERVHLNRLREGLWWWHRRCARRSATEMSRSTERGGRHLVGSWYSRSENSRRQLGGKKSARIDIAAEGSPARIVIVVTCNTNGLLVLGPEIILRFFLSDHIIALKPRWGMPKATRRSTWLGGCCRSTLETRILPWVEVLYTYYF